MRWQSFAEVLVFLIRHDQMLLFNPYPRFIAASKGGADKSIR
jgi:hypothetical protein